MESEKRREKSTSRRRSKTPQRRSPVKSRGGRSPSPHSRSRRSPSTRSRRSPSPSPFARRRRSPSPRRGRFYSPNRRRYDRRRSPGPRDRRFPPRRYGGRGGMRRNISISRSRSRSRSRSSSPMARRDGSNRWVAKGKSPSPQRRSQQPPPVGANAGSYGVMPPARLYGNEAYVAPPAFGHQYGVAAAQGGFAPPVEPYGAMQAPAPTGYPSAYPPQTNWAVHGKKLLWKLVKNWF